jgi:hypothetical protein
VKFNALQALDKNQDRFDCSDHTNKEIHITLYNMSEVDSPLVELIKKLSHKKIQWEIEHCYDPEIQGHAGSRLGSDKNSDNFEKGVNQSNDKESDKDLDPKRECEPLWRGPL